MVKLITLEDKEVGVAVGIVYITDRARNGAAVERIKFESNAVAGVIHGTIVRRIIIIIFIVCL